LLHHSLTVSHSALQQGEGLVVSRGAEQSGAKPHSAGLRAGLRTSFAIVKIVADVGDFGPKRWQVRVMQPVSDKEKWERDDGESAGSCDRGR